jgi:prolyl-tRNA editing enzyme YbaK/EbsC (Cys-tRNA(Pro) deacylase)
MSSLHPTALRFQERARDAGLDVRPQELSESARTAVEAANAVGCELGQIVKAVGEGVAMARGREVKDQTGYAIGGVPPLGHDTPLPTVADRSLQRFETVWCAAGTPNTVFEVRMDDLLAAIPDADVRDLSV